MSALARTSPAAARRTKALVLAFVVLGPFVVISLLMWLIAFAIPTKHREENQQRTREHVPSENPPAEPVR